MGTISSNEDIKDRKQARKKFIRSWKDFPILDIEERTGSTGYIDFIMQNEVTSNGMKGNDIHGRPFVVLDGVGIKQDGTQIPFFQTFFQRYTDSDTWMGCGHGGNELIDTCGGMNSSQFKLLTDLINNKIIDNLNDTHKFYDLFIDCVKIRLDYPTSS